MSVESSKNSQGSIRVSDLAQSLPDRAFTEVQLNQNLSKTLWIAPIKVEVSRLSGKKSLAIVINQPTFSQATEIDYFLTNAEANLV